MLHFKGTKREKEYPPIYHPPIYPLLKRAKPASLILEDGTFFTGYSFGADIEASGEVVFTTGMTGYPESFTDPSYEGQILVLTYPLIGNYGVPTITTAGSELEIDAISAISKGRFGTRTPHHSAHSNQKAEFLKQFSELITCLSAAHIPAMTGAGAITRNDILKKLPGMLQKHIELRGNTVSNSVISSVKLLTHPFESDRIHIKGLVVADYSRNPYHWNSKSALSKWLEKEGIPAIAGVDTRKLTKKLREKGTLLGRIVKGLPKKEHFLMPFEDPNTRNLVAEVSTGEKIEYAPISEVLDAIEKLIPPEVLRRKFRRAISRSAESRSAEKRTGEKRRMLKAKAEKSLPSIHTNRKGISGHKKIALVDCGAKNNIIRELILRDARVIRVPWNYDLSEMLDRIDGVVISNGPGDPQLATDAIHSAKLMLKRKKPVFGICLGNQILSLAAGGRTYKLKYGHRSQNQPCIEAGTKRCYITSQNHGFAVDSSSLPKDWQVWFVNANDGTNEGLKHKKLPALSVQFHPEAMPGPTDTSFLFDKFLNMINANTSRVKK